MTKDTQVIAIQVTGYDLSPVVTYGRLPAAHYSLISLLGKATKTKEKGTKRDRERLRRR